MTSFEQVAIEQPARGVARLLMNRPEVRNAQGLKMAKEAVNGAQDQMG